SSGHAGDDVPARSRVRKGLAPPQWPRNPARRHRRRRLCRRSQKQSSLTFTAHRANPPAIHNFWPYLRAVGRGWWTVAGFARRWRGPPSSVAGLWLLTPWLSAFRPSVLALVQRHL